MRSIEDMKKLFLEKGYNLLSEKYEGNKKPLTYEKDGYFYQNTYNGFIKTSNPKKWGVNNPYSIQNLKLYLKREGYTCEVVSTEYDYNNIQLKCQCGEVYSVNLSNLLSSHNQECCPKCGRNRGAIKHRKDEEYLPILDKYGLALCEEYRGAKYHHLVTTKEGYFTKVSLYNLSHGTNYEDFIFDADNKYALYNIKIWLSLYGNGLTILSKEYVGAKERYKFKCRCGEEFEANWQYIHANHAVRCPKCTHRISGLELKTIEWLKENNIEYIKEKSFSDCAYKSLLRFDFYLSELNKIIEVDGIQHFYISTFGGISKEQGKKNLRETKIRDNIKNKYCEDNNIPLLRIPYIDFKNDKYKEKLTIFTAKN